MVALIPAPGKKGSACTVVRFIGFKSIIDTLGRIQNSHLGRWNLLHLTWESFIPSPIMELTLTNTDTNLWEVTAPPTLSGKQGYSFQFGASNPSSQKAPGREKNPHFAVRFAIYELEFQEGKKRSSCAAFHFSASKSPDSKNRMSLRTSSLPKGAARSGTEPGSFSHRIIPCEGQTGARV